MQSFNLITDGRINPNFWEKEKTRSTLWDESASNKFKSVITNYQLGDISSINNLDIEATIFIEKIANAMKLISKTSMKRNRSPIQTKHESEMEILLRKKPILY